MPLAGCPVGQSVYTVASPQRRPASAGARLHRVVTEKLAPSVAPVRHEKAVASPDVGAAVDATLNLYLTPQHVQCRDPPGGHSLGHVVHDYVPTYLHTRTTIKLVLNSGPTRLPSHAGN